MKNFRLTYTERKAFDLREQGLSYERIADRLRLLDAKSAENAVYRARKKIPATTCKHCGSKFRRIAA